MFRFNETPAVIMMLDETRGDLFIAISSNQQYVVQTEQPMPDADKTTRRFASGYVGIDSNNDPVALRVASHGSFVTCKRLMPSTSCDACGCAMTSAGNGFVCTYCGNAT